MSKATVLAGSKGTVAGPAAVWMVTSEACVATADKAKKQANASGASALIMNLSIELAAWLCVHAWLAVICLQVIQTPCRVQPLQDAVGEVST